MSSFHLIFFPPVLLRKGVMELLGECQAFLSLFFRGSLSLLKHFLPKFFTFLQRISVSLGPKDQIFLFGFTFVHLQVFKMEGITENNLHNHQGRTMTPTAFLPDLFLSLTQSTCFNSGLPQISHAPFPSGRKGDNS